MAVVARPDLLGALIARLRATTEITALTSTRISGELQDAWTMPTHAVTLRRSGGPPGDYLGGIWYSRIDVTAYGSTRREATRLLDIVLPALCPLQGPPGGSFIQSAVRVYDIAPEAEMIADTEPDTGWPFAWMPLVVSWCGVPVT